MRLGKQPVMGGVRAVRENAVNRKESDGICPACGREIATVGNGYIHKGHCNPCYKRLFWRPMNTAALERDRRASREAKRRRRAAGEAV